MSFVTTTSDSVQHEPVHKIRTASSHASTELAHPTPDLQSLQGAYIQNVERLEERAERMSVGSDLGEEIRRLQQEQKLSDSRRASLYSPTAVEHHQRPRNVSTSSYANSIVEVNSAARYGGFSPYSPIGSLRSGSWSQVSHPMSNPARSMSRSSRFGIMSTPEIGEASSPLPPAAREDQATEESSSIQHTPRPQSKSNSSVVSGSVDEDQREKRMKRLSTGRLPSDGSFSQLYNQLAEVNKSTTDISGVRIVSDTSFTDIYDQIAGEIKDQLDTSVIGAQERELKRQSVIGHPLPQLPFSELQPQSSKPIRLSETPPPLPPQHRILPEAEPQEGFDVNFSFTASIKEPKPQDERRASGPLQIHVPHDEHDEHNDNASDRPSTARSQDTFQQAEGLFQDFDGTHYAPSILSRYGSLRDPAAAAFPIEDPNRSSMLPAIPQPQVTTNLIPPPEDGMVYYPAPVPRMLNLPQRISQAPSAAVLAKRKTQLLNSMPEDARKSAHWLPQNGQRPVSPAARASKLNLSSLPPQLRASVFFDPGAQRQDVEIREQSAMKTFDDLLDASALAPVSAFTDHPIVGKIGGNVYRKSQSTQNLLNVQQNGAKKERKSSFLGLRRSSVGSENALEDRRTSTLGKLTKTNSAALDDSALARGPHGEIGGGSGRSTPALDPNGVYGDLRDEHAVDDEEEDGEPQDGEESEEEYVGAPTTLLAELELRKKEQKTRTRTAFNAFPNGMHATLLELDDVAKLQEAKRKQKRVALAWEDPALKAADEMAEADDEDVPLGVLYAGNKAVAAKVKEREMAEGRPIGLIEKKEMEDNEPLSRRRMRLLGVNPNAIRTPPVAITNPEGGSESESDHEGETLGQRLKRLRDKKALDEAITEVEARPVSEAFSVDLLSQLGVETKTEKPKEDGLHSRNVSQGQISTGSAPKSPGGGLLPPSRSNANTPGGDSEEETLGQRRARLQREALQAGRRGSQMTLNPPMRMSTMPVGHTSMDPNMMPTPSRTPPPLRASVSLADILAAYPTGKNDVRKVSNDMLLASAPQGSLLAKDAEEKAARKARMRLSSAEHLGSQRPDMMPRQVSGMTAASGAGMYVNQQQMYGMWQQQSLMMQQGQGAMYAQPQQYGMIGMNGYAAASNPNLMAGMQQGMGTSMYGGGGGMYQHAQYGMGGGMMQQQFGGPLMQQDPYIDPRTRSRVDAWRQSVMQ